MARLGAQRARRRPIGWCWHPEGAGRQGDDSDGVAHHVEELHRVPFLRDAGDGVAFHDCRDVARVRSGPR